MKSESDKVGSTTAVMMDRRNLMIAGAAVFIVGAVYGYLQYAERAVREDVRKPQEDVQQQGIAEIESSKIYSTEPVEGIPADWVDKQGVEVLYYANFIKDLNLKNISPYQVMYPHFKKRGRASNTIPPRNLWANIVPTLRVIDEVASHLDAKMKPFISAYVSPQYHRATRGRRSSMRLENRAVWIQFYGVEARDVARVARLLRKQGLFKGGVGRYKSFVHIDTRGHDIDW